MADDRFKYINYARMLYSLQREFYPLLSSALSTSLNPIDIHQFNLCEKRIKMLFDKIPSPPLPADTPSTVRYTHTEFMDLYRTLSSDIIHLAQIVGRIRNGVATPASSDTSVAPVAPIAPIAPVAPTAEEKVYNFILKKFSLDTIIDYDAIISYKHYKRWLEIQTPEFKLSKTPYDMMVHWVTVVNKMVIVNCEKDKDMERIILLARQFPTHTLMKVRELVFPLYQDWKKKATIPPKTNRWQKMKMFAA